MTTDRLFQDFLEVTREHAMRSGSDPITEDPAELDARADEDEREQRWADFCAVVLARKSELHYWSDVIEEVSNALVLAEEAEDGEWPLWKASLFERACREFADLEGWDGVLSAIARAMRSA